MKMRKIIYVSGTRAEYGLMRAILKKLDDDVEIDLSICVTGMHLSPLYGSTLKEIETDAFRICGSITVNTDETTPATMVTNIGHQIIGMTEVFKKEQPDIVLLLGDRGETLAGAVAAVHLNIPIVHLHGGERSGTVDEMVRHAISKFSHYHFVATRGSKERLIKMGEEAAMVHVIGAPGLDEINATPTSSREAFYARYQLNQDKKVALMVFHPVVQAYHEMALHSHAVMKASLDMGLQLICLEPNSDAGGQLIRTVLRSYESHPDVRIFTHLLRKDYLDCMANVDVMIGNSSSAIIEAASFNLIAVNIGIRQNLREQGDNIINVDESFEAIIHGIKRALETEKRAYFNIYGDGKSSERCCRLLKTITLDSQILNKCNVY